MLMFGLQFSFCDDSIELRDDFNAATEVDSEVRSLMDTEENRADDDKHSRKYKAGAVFADKIEVCISK